MFTVLLEYISIAKRCQSIIYKERVDICAKYIKKIH